jgi:hypothetical protein
MYRLLRNVHLVTGLLALWILLLYGLSSVQMAHWYLFPDTKRVAERTVPVRADTGDVQAFERELRERHGVRGHLKSIKEDGDALYLRFHHPAVETDVVRVGDGDAAISETSWGLVMWPGRLHHDAGVWWDDGWMNLWGVAVVAVSLACILLGVTGVYLWWRLGIERKTGAILLLGSLVYTLGLIAAIRIA